MSTKNNNAHHFKVNNRAKPVSETTKVDTNEEELLSSSSEDESSQVSIGAFSTVGSVKNAFTSPLMNLFNIPCNNLPAIQGLHCEVFKLLQPNSMNPITT